MRKNSVRDLAVAALALALGACGRESPTTGDTAQPSQPSQVVGDSAAASPDAALQAQLEAAFVGKTTPPDPEGFISHGGGLVRGPIGVGAIWVAYGRWRHAGGEQGVMFVQRTTGIAPVDGFLPAEIVSVYAMPAPLPNENLVDLFCTHPDFSEDSSRIYANAGREQQRPGLMDPPSAAWRLDIPSARLLPIDAARVTCVPSDHHME